MTTELTVLTLATLLQSVQFALKSVPGNRYSEASPQTRGQQQMEHDFRDLLSPRTRQILQAMDHHFEAFVLFAIAALILTLADESSALTRVCAWVYLLARIAYIPAFVYGGTPWRALVWNASFGATFAMLLAAVV